MSPVLSLALAAARRAQLIANIAHTVHIRGEPFGVALHRLVHDASSEGHAALRHANLELTGIDLSAVPEPLADSCAYSLIAMHVLVAARWLLAREAGGLQWRRLVAR